MKKKKILVYWPYGRKDLLLPFDKLSGYFEWCFIFFASAAEDAVALPYQKVYWTDYKSPFALLRDVAPDKVIFFELSNLNTVGLNYACKNKGIPTFILDHGVKVAYEHYILYDAAGDTSGGTTAAIVKNKAVGSNAMRTLRFYFSGLRPRNFLNIPRAAYFLFKVYQTKSDAVFEKVKFAFRKPHRYLLFSPQNFSYYNQRDGLSAQDVIYFGNPYFDDMIRELATPTPSQAYYLLLDDGQIDMFGVTLVQKNEFLRQLKSVALAHGVRLHVKLHPADYARTDLYQDENIVYIKDADIAGLVRSARGIFGISSSLILPLIPMGKIILFRVQNCPIQDDLQQEGVPFVNFYNFTPDDINFERAALPEGSKQEFIKKFLYSYDGKARERLREILQQ